MLPTSDEIVQRMGLEHGIPITQLEIARREVQIFLLLRSLYCQCCRLEAGSPEETAHAGEPAVRQTSRGLRLINRVTCCLNFFCIAIQMILR
jgi:hypothetical protein